MEGRRNWADPRARFSRARDWNGTLGKVSISLPRSMSVMGILHHPTGTIRQLHARTYDSSSTSPNGRPAGIPNGGQAEPKSSSWQGISTAVTRELPGIPQSGEAR
jgi:hypothetical protein